MICLVVIFSLRCRDSLIVANEPAIFYYFGL